MLGTIPGAYNNYLPQINDKIYDYMQYQVKNVKFTFSNINFNDLFHFYNRIAIP